MVRVAIAGGSGGLGRVITETIAASGKHEVLVLSRKGKSDSGDKTKIQTLEVDYSDIDNIAGVLRSNNVEVVLSTIGILFEDTHISQMNLIDGAERSGTVKRFAPSEFAVDYVAAIKSGFPSPVPGLGEYKSTMYKVQAFEKLQTTGMEHTRFIIGFLMDYYGFPAEPIPVLPLAVVLDLENHRAGIPVDGETPVTLTHSETIAKFVTASLDLPAWPSKSWIVGDTLSWNEALRIAEDVRGKKFDVTYDTIEDLENSKITELPANVPRYAVAPKPLLDGILSVWSLGFAKGWFNLPTQKGSDKTANESFSDIEVLKFRPFLERAWKQKSSI